MAGEQVEQPKVMIGVELAERDVQRPVAIAEMPQRIGGEVKKLADAHSGAA